MKKYKVVWLCPFANKEVAEMLGINNQPMVAPWISELIELFRNRHDVEIVIVSPNYYTNTAKDLCIDNIHVYLFKYKPDYLPKVAYNLTYNYSIPRKSIRSIIDKVKPDLIHLFGSENPHYSAALMDLYTRYPILVSLQGFVHLSTRPANLISKYIRWNRVRFEKKINQQAKYISYTSSDSLQALNEINPTSIKFQSNFPTTVPTVQSDDYPDKKYDLVFYARVTRNKGVEDFIEAVHKLKDSVGGVKAIIIGGATESYLNTLKQQVKSLNLEENIEFAGFQPAQKDVFNLAVQAKIYVLPSYFDGTPGTIREAMYMKLPVVAYNVGGIPSFNEEKECITLAESRNIADLVDKIVLVMNDEERTTRLVSNAYEMACRTLDNNIVYDNFIRFYTEIIELENEKN